MTEIYPVNNARTPLIS